MTKKSLGKLKAIALKFAKGFVTGGLGAFGGLLSGGITITTVADLQHLGIVGVSAFLSGGALALIKLYTWED